MIPAEAVPEGGTAFLLVRYGKIKEIWISSIL